MCSPARRQANPRFRNDRQFRSNPTNNGSLGAGALPRSDPELPGVTSTPGPLSYKRLSKNGPRDGEEGSRAVRRSLDDFDLVQLSAAAPLPTLMPPRQPPPRRVALFQLQSARNYRYNVRCLTPKKGSPKAIRRRGASRKFVPARVCPPVPRSSARFVLI